VLSDRRLPPPSSDQSTSVKAETVSGRNEGEAGET